MTKIEDMSLPSYSLIEYPLRLLTQNILLCKQRNRIEIPHYRDGVSNPLPRLVESDTPVEPDHIAARFTHQFQQRRRSRAEVNNGNTLRHIPDHTLSMRQHKLTIVIRTQTPHPRIKQLRRLGACCDLCVEIFHERSRDQRHHRVPRAGVVVHQLLGMHIILRPTTFRFVRREGERPPTKTT